MLGEEVRAASLTADVIERVLLAAWKQPTPERRERTCAILEALGPHVAALLTQVRADRDGEGQLPTIQLVGGLSPLRYGQALFNDLYRVAPEIADSIRSGEDDPFYEDERVPAFLRALVAQAHDRGAAEERERIMREITAEAERHRSSPGIRAGLRCALDIARSQ